MSTACHALHNLSNSLNRYKFPFRDSEIPLNGIYLLFEKNESGHDRDRIVRVGTHTGENQLRSRIKQHFENENKDRSIFRKNIGRAILNKQRDSFLKYWELDLTSRKSKEQYSSQIDFDYQKSIENVVTDYIQDNFSFVVIEVNEKSERLILESKLISTVSWCDKCEPSDQWLGLSSTKAKIVTSGLWLVNQLYKDPLNESDIANLMSKTEGH